MIRLLEAIAGVAAHASREEDQGALLQQARMIQRGSQEAIPEGRDQEDVEAQYRAVEQALLMRSAAIAPRSTRFSRRNDACERSSAVTKASKAPNTGGNMGDLIDIEQ
jgi:hypothetical protein